MDTAEKVKSKWARSFFTALNRKNDEERYICDICQKDFTNPSSLTLHRDTHVIERPFRCEPCQVSFNTQGHLQKHKRSSAHETRVAMTQSFGVPTNDNPRPYGCPACEVAFRKHGHLAKHLRSKSHITKMEMNGLVPVGTYAALEKCGPDVRDKLVTTNCEQSLESLRSLASALARSPPPTLLSSPPQAHSTTQPSPLLYQQSILATPQHLIPMMTHHSTGPSGGLLAPPEVNRDAFDDSHDASGAA